MDMHDTTASKALCMSPTTAAAPTADSARPSAARWRRQTAAAAMVHAAGRGRTRTSVRPRLSRLAAAALAAFGRCRGGAVHVAGGCLQRGGGGGGRRVRRRGVVGSPGAGAVRCMADLL
eukprot:364730-Chlamydomonas_euryale.AAC.16